MRPTGRSDSYELREQPPECISVSSGVSRTNKESLARALHVSPAAISLPDMESAAGGIFLPTWLRVVILQRSGQDRRPLMSESKL